MWTGRSPPDPRLCTQEEHTVYCEAHRQLNKHTYTWFNWKEVATEPYVHVFLSLVVVYFLLLCVQIFTAVESMLFIKTRWQFYVVFVCVFHLGVWGELASHKRLFNPPPQFSRLGI